MYWRGGGVYGGIGGHLLKGLRMKGSDIHTQLECIRVRILVFGVFLVYVVCLVMYIYIRILV